MTDPDLTLLRERMRAHMADLQISVKLSATERSVIKEASSKALVTKVMHDLEKTITTDGNPVGDLTRYPNKAPSADQIEAAVTGLTQRRENLLALPETDARTEAVEKIDAAITVLNDATETMKAIPQHLRERASAPSPIPDEAGDPTQPSTQDDAATE